MDNLIMPKFHIFIAALLVIVLSSCGAGAGPSPTPAATPTPFPTYSFVQKTEAQSIVTISAETATAGVKTALDPDKVALGKGRYDALQCGDCHGDHGQGTDKAPALVGTKLTQDQFIDFLRSGGKLGNDHLYSTNRLSDEGGKNLYLYILSLETGAK